MSRILAIATNLFPVWVLLGGALALAHPAWFTWFSGGFITWGLAVFLLHTGGFFLGYLASRLLRCDELTSRTISVEVGMQNSGLGAALAEKHFTSLPLAPLPCAISATFHSVIGSLLAGAWRLRPVKPREYNRARARDDFSSSLSN